MDREDIEKNGWIRERELHICIEMTDLCNLSCIMCNHHINGDEGPHFSRKGLMNFDTWKRMMDGIKNSNTKITGLSPFWLGESTLHPEFNEMISYAFDNNKDNCIFTTFTLNTNACLLNDEMIDTILRCANRDNMRKGTFSYIIFSIDATSKETYLRVKQRDEFDKVIRNVKKFVNRQLELGLEYPKCVFQFIVMPENYHEALEFFNYWKEFLDKHGIDYQINYDYLPPFDKHTIFITKLNSGFPERDERLHKEVIYRIGLINEEQLKKKRILLNDQDLEPEKARRPCPALWKSPMIKWDGKVACCCRDVALEQEIGDLNKNSLSEIMNGEKLKKLRLAHIRGDLKEYPLCEKCENLPNTMITDREILNYLDELGLIEEKENYIRRMNSKQSLGSRLKRLVII